MLDRILERLTRSDRQFTVYGRDGGTDIEEQFAAHSVTVDCRQLPPDGPDPFVVVEEAGEFVGVLPVTELEWLLTPPVVRPTSPAAVSPGYRVLFEVLDETVFTALNRRQLDAVSKEIEDRARRVGSGRLRASFQQLSTFADQVEWYWTLGEAGLDIHVYGAPDWEPPAIPGVTYHGYGDGSVERYWVLTFDGGSDPSQACGLAARADADSFDGFWTDDAELVEEIEHALRAEAGVD
ncbi:DICT sensory domain-containing protein [Haloarchaeobius iranensis]|uniref:Diguanylate Cyclase and Two-component system sensory domain-containing protein n=1 Tax=Haloarchaeobius iranensis TaxID=996166 RepID=A0A1G9UB04_9EURY|nr:DICT sensory domain-containing protein [Haloarchaeobius iranensis]SDM57156.1 Diguanylate Cyclase and Two-component system sensory domain-containing protein [Haloarchaeobius iranensis]